MQSIQNKPKKRQRKAPLIIGIAVAVVVLAGGYTALASWNSWPSPLSLFTSSNEDASTHTSPDQPVNTVDLSGPNKEDVENSQRGKENSTGNSDSPSGGVQSSAVPVGISYSGVTDQNLEVRAFIPSVIEGDGVCTATLVKGRQTVQAKSAAFIDTSTSQCEPILIPLSSLPGLGQWSLTVTYTSPTHQGTSESTEVNL